VAQGTLVFAWAMVDLAAISFLGLGVQPPTADWGVMVATGETGVLQGYPLESLSAGLCIVLVVVAVSLLGERVAAASERRGVRS
jgi:peptide/nickel transport system permease protein